MIIEKFSFNKAEDKVPLHILYPLYWDLVNFKPSNSKKGVREIRRHIIEILGTHGWSKKILVSPTSQITITAKYEDVGLCLQFGNMARFYADLLKLQLMYVNKIIGSAIYILPLKEFASNLGSNVVNFERFTSELEVFQKIINVPIMVLGIQGG